MTDESIIHVAYAEDHKIVRKGIVSIINNLGEIHIDIEAKDGKELIQLIQKAKQIPDVCILDINMPGMNGFETIKELKKKWPDIKVLVLTAFDLEMYIIRMILLGANGYLLKKCDPEHIKSAVISIYKNGMYYSDIATHQFFNRIHNKEIRLPNFTEKELQVLQYCPGDLSYSQIAEKMGTTTRSVEGFRDSLFKKLNTHSRISLALFAVQFGLVQLEINSTDDINILNKKHKK